MKKILKIILIILIIISIPILLYFMFRTPEGTIKEGKYYVVDFKEYPKAYIEIEDNTIKMYNIDLNKIFQEKQLEKINKMKESGGFDTGLTDEQLLEVSDLNKMFVDNAYTYDIDKASKEGTYTWIYPCLGEGNWFGLWFTNDSFDETLTIKSDDLTIVFSMKK